MARDSSRMALGKPQRAWLTEPLNSGQGIGVPLTEAAKRTADSKSSAPTAMARYSRMQLWQVSSKKRL